MTARWPARAAISLAAALGAAATARLALLGAPQLDYDEGVYWQSLRALARGHALYRDVYSSQPPGFLLILQPGFLAFGQGIGGARAAVAVLSLGLVAGAWLAVRREAGLLAALTVAGMAAFDPLLLRVSITLQADVPAVALAMLAFGVGVEASGRSGRTALGLAALAGFLAAVSVLVKVLAAPLAAGLLVMLVRPGDRRPLAALVLGGAAGVLAVLAPYARDLGEVWQQSVVLHLHGRSVEAGGITSVVTVPPGGELAFFLLAAAGVAVEWRAGSRRLTLALLAWLGAAVAFLAVHRPVYPHHVVAVSAPAAVLAGLAGYRAARAVLPGPAVAAALVPAALAACFGVVHWFPAALPVTPARLAAAVPAGRPVVTDDQFLAAAAGLDTPPWLVDTSQLRVDSGELTEARAEQEIQRANVGAVIFVTGRLAVLPGFTSWVATTFPDRDDLGAGVVVFRRG